MLCNIAVIALDLTAERKIFLHALLQSLKFYCGPVLPLSLISDDPSLSLLEPSIKYNVAPPSTILNAELPDDLPLWYHEQLLSLYFSASRPEEFSLILPIGSFALKPLEPHILIIRNKARTTWENVDLHSDWWMNAKELTQRIRASPWEGPSILPAILNNDLARWTLDIVRRESRQNPLETLIQAAHSGKNWSAMSLYATACGSRFLTAHLDAYSSRSHRLLSNQCLWSPEGVNGFRPASRDADDSGLFTYVQVNAFQNSDKILDLLYASLKSETMEQNLLPEMRQVS